MNATAHVGGTQAHLPKTDAKWQFVVALTYSYVQVASFYRDLLGIQHAMEKGRECGTSDRRHRKFT
jgi:hypothetical protein